MRTVDDFAEIRRLHRNHLSARKIALQLGVGRDTVRKALANPEPVPYTLKKPRSAPIFGAFRQLVDDILIADQTAPPKQRHTATQIFRRLVADHSYAGGYPTPDCTSTHPLSNAPSCSSRTPTHTRLPDCRI
jgi:transposase